MIKKANFYHVITGELLLSSCQIVSKLYDIFDNILVICDSPEELSIFDDKLWVFASAAFIPHAVVGDEYESRAKIKLTHGQSVPTGSFSCVCITTKNDSLYVESLVANIKCDNLICIFNAENKKSPEFKSTLKKIGADSSRYLVDLDGKWQDV